MQYWKLAFKSAGLEERREGVEELKVTSTTDSVDKHDNPLSEGCVQRMDEWGFQFAHYFLEDYT